MITVFNSEINFNDLFKIIKSLGQPHSFGEKKSLNKLLTEVHGKEYDLTYSSSGRVSLYKILKSLNIKKKHKVALQAFTCSVVPKAIIESNAIPIYIDIEKTTLSMDFNDLKQKIQDVDVVLIQYTFGLTPKYLEKIYDLCKKLDKAIVLDKAHCMPEIINNRQTFIENNCEGIFYSTDHTKAITAIRGGICLSKKPVELNPKKLKHFKVSLPFFLETFLFNEKYYFLARIFFFIAKLLNYKYMPADEDYIAKSSYLIESRFWRAIVTYQISRKKLRRNQIIQFYLKIKDIFDKYNLAYVPNLILDNSNTPLRIPIIFDTDLQKRNFLRICKNNGINISDWFGGVLTCKQNEFSLYGYKLKTCMHAEKLSKKIVGFPCSKRFRNPSVLEKLDTILAKF